MTDRVAFLGLGVMGYPMAGWLARKGHEVTVFNRTAAKAAAWCKTYGGRAAATPAAAAAEADIVFTCVGDDPDLRAVVLGPDGALAGMRAGAIFVDHTTASAGLAREIAAAGVERGIACLDAPVSGGQAGAENGVSGMASILGRVDMCSGAGLVYGARVFSPVQMVLDAELMELIAQFAEGYDFDADTFQLDAIDRVGPAGHFLDQDHTLVHMREFWRETFMDRRNWDTWEKEGRPDPRVAATAKAKEILATHEPDALPDGMEAELDAIMATYEAQALAEAS